VHDGPGRGTRRNHRDRARDLGEEIGSESERSEPAGDSVAHDAPLLQRGLSRIHLAEPALHLDQPGVVDIGVRVVVEACDQLVR